MEYLQTFEEIPFSSQLNMRMGKFNLPVKDVFPIET